MWTNQSEMFGDGTESRLERHQRDVNQETIRRLDDLASRIADGDVRVQYLGEQVDDDYLGAFPEGDSYPKTLEVTYRAD